MNAANDNSEPRPLNRRRLIQSLAASAVTLAAGANLVDAAEGKAVTKGNLNRQAVSLCEV